MIHLGIIGTNWITHQFVQAAQATGEYKLTAVYSRKMTTAQTFAKNYDQKVTCLTDLDAFVQSDEMETIYIASPNSLHFSQARLAILAGKNVIVEKPAFSTPVQMQEIIDLAHKKQVFFFEAARNIHEAAFQTVADHLSTLGTVIGANFTFMKYSSRYDLVLVGEEPNIFSTRFSGGSLADIGVYPIYAALALFGKPSAIHHFARKIQTGVDGIGTLVLRYQDFDVTVMHGKIGDATLASEIYLSHGTVTLDGINTISQVTTFDRRTKQKQELAIDRKENPMIEEARDFAEIIKVPEKRENKERYQKWCQLAVDVNQVLYEARIQAGIHFKDDEE